VSANVNATSASSGLESGTFVERARTRTLVVDVTIVAVASLALGLVRLGAPALWFDEAYTYAQIRKGYLEQFAGYQPFYYWVQKPWTSLAGTSEWAMRFPSVVGAMLACALLVVLARRLFDSSTALVAGLLLATSPFFVKWSQQARVYPLLVAASLVATLLLLRALDRGTRGAWALYGIAYAGLLVTHGIVGLLLLPAHLVLAAQRRERVLPHGLLAAVIVAAIGLPWLGQLAMRTSSDTSETAWIPFPSVGYAVHSLLWVSGATGLGLLLAVLGLWALASAGRRTTGVWLATWALAPFALALVVSTVRPIFLDRYLIVAAPAFSLLGGIAITRSRGVLRPLLVAVVAAATVVGLVHWYSLGVGGNWRGEEWRGAAAFVDRRGAGDVVVVPWWASTAAAYYGASVRPSATGQKALWVLSWSEDGHRLPRSERAPLGFGNYRLAERRSFGWRLDAERWVRQTP
jgi:mannosyltransferase